MGRLLAGFLLAAAALAASPAAATEKPKVRTICAFVRIDRAGYRAAIEEALSALRATRQAFERDGWSVETIRITTQPFPEYVRGLSRADALRFLAELDALAVKEDVLLGIGPAMSADADDPAMMELLGEALVHARMINATALIAAEDGIHWRTVRAAARMVKALGEASPGGYGLLNFTAAAMMPPHTPFYPASYHTGRGRRIAVGLESASVVQQVFAETGGDPAVASARLATELGRHARRAEEIASAAAARAGWEYLGLDPTPAPLKDVSIGAAIESYTGRRMGSSGTLTAARLITDAVRAVPVKQVGYSGLMLPVLEDSRLADRWSEGALSLDALLAYSSVCATGLDTVPLPGDVTEDQIARIFGDVASLAARWNKPLTARLLPVKGRKAGERSAFDDPFFVNAVLQPLP
jgi:uncharacterized protein (UPF0210 family)